MTPFSKIELSVDGKKIEHNDMRIVTMRYSSSVSDTYTLTLVAKRGNLEKEFNKDDFIAKKVSFSFSYKENKQEIEVKYAGVVRDFSKTSKFVTQRSNEYFVIVIVPEFFGKGSCHNKVFLNKSTIDIAKYLVENHTNLKFSSKASGGASSREFTLQCQDETDKDFFERVLSEEGIYYRFDQENGEVVLYDGADYVDSKVAVDIGPGVEGKKFYTGQMKKYILHDHNFESPKTDLTIDKENSETNCFAKDSVEIWPYPGGLNKSTSDGTSVITKLLDGQKAGGTSYEFTVTGSPKVVLLDVCSKFKLYNDRTRKVENDYVVIKLETQLDFVKSNVVSDVVAIDATVVYLPALLPPPSISLLPAEVIGPDNSQRNYTDSGIQVKFYWQTDNDKEDTNCWIRVAQLWAGKDYGTFFRPTIGSEVIVSFLYGPNRKPVIIGCLHDAEVKYPNEDKNFCSGIITKNEEGKKSTELIFDDTKDKEKFTINTAYDYGSEIENDRTISILKGADSLTVEEKDRTVEIKKGNENITLAKGSRTIKANDDHSISAKTQEIKADKTINIEANSTITLKVGGSKIVISNSSIEISAPTVSISAKAQVKIEGNFINSNANAINILKGGIVKIN
jgi:type VI secretion system secreted protein VgrG